MLKMETGITEMCRICLELKPSHMMLNIQNIAEVIMSFADVDIYENDGLPQCICNYCYIKANESYIYKLKCEESDCSLRIDEDVDKKLKDMKKKNDSFTYFSPEILKQVTTFGEDSIFYDTSLIPIPQPESETGEMDVEENENSKEKQECACILCRFVDEI